MTPLFAGSGRVWRKVVKCDTLEVSNNLFSSDNIFNVLSIDEEKQELSQESLNPTSPQHVLITELQGTLVENSVLPLLVSRNDRAELSTSLSSLLDYLSLYGFDPIGQKTSPTLKHWQICSAECSWMKFLKYKLSSFFSSVLGEELPPCPFKTPDYPLHLIGGRAGRFISKVLKGPLRLEFAVGILYLKKGCARPGKPELKAALVATKKVLTSKRPVPIPTLQLRDDWDNILPPINLGDMGVEMRRTTREFFSGHTITQKDLHKPFAPSIKANYVDSRSDLGTFGTLIELGLIKTVDEGLDSIFRDILTGSKESEFREGSDESRLVAVKAEFIRLLEERYSVTYDQACLLADEEVANVKLVALAEALKVRVISKGPPLTYFVLKPVQKFLHRILRKHKMLRLIGEPVSTKILESMFKDHPPGYLYHSLDYSSATDFLNPYISNEIADHICKVISLPSLQTRLFKKALTGHLVEGEEQQWGQLMGSIVSFIVLCIANCAVIRRSLEITHNRMFTLEECPAVVNGDDGLVDAPHSFLEIWKQIASLCGLEPSQGKVYSHRDYLNINSTSYLRRGEFFQHIPYVNMGLAKGFTRSGGKKEDRNEKVEIYDTSLLGSLGSRHHALIRSSPDHCRIAVHKLFLRENWKLLNSVRVPWYVSEDNGGLGLMPIVTEIYADSGDIDDFVVIPHETYGPSVLDLELLASLDKSKTRGPRFRRLPTNAPIAVRSVWSTRLGEPVRGIVMGDRDIQYLDTACYYFCPEFVTQTIKESPNAILRNNERVWSALHVQYKRKSNSL